MPNRNYNRGVYLIVALCAALTGCSVLAPAVSKAQTEEQQLVVMKQTLELQRREVEALERIADRCGK